MRNAGGRQAPGRFATVKYLHMGKAKHTAVPIGPGQQVEAGDRGYVKLDDCRPESLAKRNSE